MHSALRRKESTPDHCRNRQHRCDLPLIGETRIVNRGPPQGSTQLYPSSETRLFLLSSSLFDTCQAATIFHCGASKADRNSDHDLSRDRTYMPRALRSPPIIRLQGSLSEQFRLQNVRNKTTHSLPLFKLLYRRKLEKSILPPEWYLYGSHWNDLWTFLFFRKEVLKEIKMNIAHAQNTESSLAC